MKKSGVASRKLQNVQFLFAHVAERDPDERAVGSFKDFFIADMIDEVRSGDTKPKHLIFSAICYVVVIYITLGDIIEFHFF